MTTTLELISAIEATTRKIEDFHSIFQSLILKIEFYDGPDVRVLSDIQQLETELNSMSGKMLRLKLINDKLKELTSVFIAEISAHKDSLASVTNQKDLKLLNKKLAKLYFKYEDWRSLKALLRIRSNHACVISDQLMQVILDYRSFRVG